MGLAWVSGACGASSGPGGETSAGSSGVEVISTSSSTTGVDADSSTSSTTGPVGTSTGPAQPVEYQGLWTVGLGLSRFRPCGEDETWLVSNGGALTEALEFCRYGYEHELYLRFTAVELPRPPNDPDTPRLEAVTLLEGPCRVDGCDTEPQECGEWWEFCLEG